MPPGWGCVDGREELKRAGHGEGSGCGGPLTNSEHLCSRFFVTTAGMEPRPCGWRADGGNGVLLTIEEVLGRAVLRSRSRLMTASVSSEDDTLVAGFRFGCIKLHSCRSYTDLVREMALEAAALKDPSMQLDLSMGLPAVTPQASGAGGGYGGGGYGGGGALARPGYTSDDSLWRSAEAMKAAAEADKAAALKVADEMAQEERAAAVAAVWEVAEADKAAALVKVAEEAMRTAQAMMLAVPKGVESTQPSIGQVGEGGASAGGSLGGIVDGLQRLNNPWSQSLMGLAGVAVLVAMGARAYEIAMQRLRGGKQLPELLPQHEEEMFDEDI